MKRSVSWFIDWSIHCIQKLDWKFLLRMQDYWNMFCYIYMYVCSDSRSNMYLLYGNEMGGVYEVFWEKCFLFFENKIFRDFSDILYSKLSIFSDFSNVRFFFFWYFFQKFRYFPDFQFFLDLQFMGKNEENRLPVLIILYVFYFKIFWHLESMHILSILLSL